MAIYARKRVFEREVAAPTTRELIESLRFYTANLTWLTVALLVFGLFIGYSASSTRLISEGLSPLREIKYEAIWAAFGLLAMFIAPKILNFPPNARGWKMLWLVKFFYWSSAISLVVVLFSKAYKGSTRTLDLGIVQFQPTEIAKFGLVIYLLYLILVEHTALQRGGWHIFGHYFRRQIVNLADERIRIRSAFIATGLILILLILQPDIGSTLLLGTLAAAAMFLGGIRLRVIIASAIVAVSVFLLVFFTMGSKFKHVDVRLKAWMNPLGETSASLQSGSGVAQTDKESYQILQSLGAVANGGLAGKGLFKGVQKINRLPEATNDFIFAVICEELGFFGAFGVVLAYCALLYFTCMIAMCIRSPFYSALVFLIGFAIFLQAAINMGAAVNLVPTTGINLPLISFGGTSRVFTLFQIGVILAIANAFLRFESPKTR